MPIQFTVHTVNYDQLIWMILEETIVDERSEINRLAQASLSSAVLNT